MGGGALPNNTQPFLVAPVVAAMLALAPMTLGKHCWNHKPAKRCGSGYGVGCPVALLPGPNGCTCCMHTPDSCGD